MAKKKAAATADSLPEGGKAQPQRILKFIKAFSDCPVFYSNIGQVSTSKNEVRLVLAQSLDVTDSEHVVNPQVVIYLPHDHAKKVAEVLLEQLAKIAEIKVPER